MLFFITWFTILLKIVSDDISFISFTIKSPKFRVFQVLIRFHRKMFPIKVSIFVKIILYQTFFLLQEVNRFKSAIFIVF